MSGDELAAVVEAALAIVARLLVHALDGAATAEQAIDRLVAVDGQLDGTLEELRQRLAANDQRRDRAS